MSAAEIHAAARELVQALCAAGKTLATAESCTGGWIAKAVTDVPGSSACFGYGIVSYSNGAKESVLGVHAATLQAHGAVSEAVVREMAEGVLALSGADVSVAVSGVAGPDGGTAEKPVGTVWLAWARRSKSQVHLHAEQLQIDGDREAVRAATVLAALAGISERLRQYG